MISLICRIQKIMVQVNLFTEQKDSHRCGKQTYGYQGGGGGGINLDTGIDIHPLLYIKWITNKKACCDPWGRKELDTTERLN